MNSKHLIAFVIIFCISTAIASAQECKGGDRYLQRFPNIVVSSSGVTTSVHPSEQDVNEMKNEVIEDILDKIDFQFTDKLCKGDCPSGESCKIISLKSSGGLTLHMDTSWVSYMYTTPPPEPKILSISAMYIFGNSDEDKPVSFWSDCDCFSAAGDKKKHVDNSFELDYNRLIVTTYPNPATSIIKLDIKLPESNLMTITIHNTLGERIYETAAYTLKGDYRRQVQLPDSTPSGTYIINVKVGEHTATQKVVVVKP